jgi:hypothetical protein
MGSITFNLSPQYLDLNLAESAGRLSNSSSPEATIPARKLNSFSSCLTPFVPPSNNHKPQSVFLRRIRVSEMRSNAGILNQTLSLYYSQQVSLCIALHVLIRYPRHWMRPEYQTSQFSKKISAGGGTR